MKLNHNRRNFLKQLLFLGGLLAIQGELVSACGDTTTAGLQAVPNSTAPAAPQAPISPGLVPVKSQPSDVPTGYEQVGPVGKFKPNDDPQGVTVGRKNVLIFNNGSGFNVFDDFCTHQGCQVQYAARPQKFICPCHGSEFNKKGEVIKGPALSPLKRIDFKVVEGTIYVNLAR